MAKPKLLILVDGSSYLFRAFHALPPLVNSKRQPTGAVKGVINMIRKLIKDYPDGNIAIVFDAKGKTFRNDMYSEYKAHRPPMPDELRSQIEPIHNIISAMGLPLLIIDGVEADDVIGTLAQQASESAVNTVISTGDKDLAQLVNKHVTLINTMTNEELNEAAVEQKFGIPPALIIDFLALTGDKVDNIPGVPSVGPKTAVKWLLEYHSMEGIIEHAEEVKGKVGEKLRENIDQLRLSYELATIKLDCKLNLNLQDLVTVAEDKHLLHDLYSQLEFKSWIKELEEAGVAPKENIAETSQKAADKSDAEAAETAGAIIPEQIDYTNVVTEKELHEVLEALAIADKFALSLELEGSHFLSTMIVGISISTVIGKAFYIPLAHSIDKCPEQLDTTTVIEQLKPFLEDGNIAKAAYDLKLIAHVFANYGVELWPFKFDAHLASYVLNSVASKHHLSDIAMRYLDLSMQSVEKDLGKGKNKLTLAQLPLDTIRDYACEKADVVLRLSNLLPQELSESGHLAGLYGYYELALIPALQRMENNGIRVDVEVLQKQSEELGNKLDQLQQKAYEAAGEEFNLGSPKQLQAVFYEKLKLPVLKKTPTGQPSTAEPVLQELAEEFELPKLILEYRGLSKLKSTYTDKLPLEVNSNTGRIHSSFQQAVAATGRLSSTDPNLQNIPIRTAEGRRVRQAFVAAPGYKLMAADYSQVELRIMAHLSQDEGLLTAFSQALDVHRATASDVFGVPLDSVTVDQRRSAKAINFGLIYGMSAFGLANQLGISRSAAQDYVDLYFEKYPGVRHYMDQTQALADEKGYVETLFGRRLYLPDIHAGNGMLRKAAQRTAINAPMQGTAADIIKHAMVDIYNWLAMNELDARMLLQVHDELVFEVSEEDLDLLADGVRFRMVSAAAMDVPLVVDIGVGANWDEAH